MHSNILVNHHFTCPVPMGTKLDQHPSTGTIHEYILIVIQNKVATPSSNASHKHHSTGTES